MTHQITRLEVELAPTDTIAAVDINGDTFTVKSIRWKVYTYRDDVIRTIVLRGTTADGDRGAQALSPEFDSAAIDTLPHPGLWFDELAAQIEGGVSR